MSRESLKWSKESQRKTYSQSVQVVPLSGPRELTASLKPLARGSRWERISPVLSTISFQQEKGRGRNSSRHTALSGVACQVLASPGEVDVGADIEMSNGPFGDLVRTSFFRNDSSRSRGGKESKNSCWHERFHICERLEELNRNFEVLDQDGCLPREMER